MRHRPNGNDPDHGSRAPRTYTNPVYDGYFADPFVWRHGDAYYAVGTGAREAAGVAGQGGTAGQGSIFPLLRSDDFVSWRQVGHALEPPDPRLGHSFWAPEVAEEGRAFYLYYSVGFEDKNHQLRVAVSERPEGPYRDVGTPLLEPTATPFAIDPHPFRDADGQWYLFYARDFLDPGLDFRVGTALAARRMDGMVRLGDEETVILRAGFDWQRFQRDRPMYGGVFDWHTLEGPCVRRHGGGYFCFYSGGRWEGETYGVDYAVADRVLGPYVQPAALEWPRLLRSVPGRLLGPGHNSVVAGPDGVTEYLAYHAWDVGLTARRLCLDRLRWSADGPACDGPTWEAQVVPC
jgi:GH43 family beta-xylosidase